MGTTLDAVDGDSATLSTGEMIPTRTVVWTAGVKPHPSLTKLSVPLDERGRVEVDDRLAVKGMAGVWAIGDCAAVPDPKRGHSPPAAQYAIRQAKVAAANVASELGVGESRRYTYSSTTAFVNLGRYKAVGSLGGRTFSGFLAWWMARSYHLSQIPGMFRKLRAVIDWTVSLPFKRDLSEVGSIGHPRPLRDEAYELGGSHRPLDAD
jgi:NADH dehydrogenase